MLYINLIERNEREYALNKNTRITKIGDYCKMLLRVFENRILMRIFGPNMDENGEWRIPHNEELHSLYRSLG